VRSCLDSYRHRDLAAFLRPVSGSLDKKGEEDATFSPGAVLAGDWKIFQPNGVVQNTGLVLRGL
jgi:hypothetical protein